MGLQHARPQAVLMFLAWGPHFKNHWLRGKRQGSEATERRAEIPAERHWRGTDPLRAVCTELRNLGTSLSSRVLEGTPRL